MRVAAGVLLIFAAAINLFAGIFYLGGGAAIGSMDKIAAMAAEAQQRQGRELTEKQKRDFARWNEARDKMSPAERAKMESGARIAMAYGLFLLITVGTSIAGAVSLFRRRGARFIVVAAVLALTVEVIGCVIAAVVLGVGVGATKLVFSSVGIIAGILALLGARQISIASTVVDPPSTAAPT